MYCHNCGCQIEENLVICPCCGAVQPNPYANGQFNGQYNGPNNMAKSKSNYNWTCVFGCVLSAIGFVVNSLGVLGFILPIAGVIISFIGIVTVDSQIERGKVFAILGLAMGGFQILMSIIALMFFMFGGINIFTDTGVHIVL